MSTPITPVVIAPPALRKKSPLPLWDHQVDAIAAIHAGVARQQVAMACGTGKSVTGQHAALTFLQGRPGTLLVLAPTLALLKQLYDSWVKQAPFGFRAIAVCSTLTAAEKREAGVEADIPVTDLPLPATTDADVLTEFITADTSDIRVVFGSYQSLKVIIAAHAPLDKDKKKKKTRLPRWDAVLCDEAHRTAGDRTKAFARVLYDHYVPAEHRLFLTATPKIHDATAGNAALIASMDDEDLYGKQVYRISVAEAVDLKILSKYQVAVIGVLDSELEAASAAVGHATVDGRRVSMDNLATIVALSKAARERGLRAVIAFFNSINASKEFVAAFTTVHAALGEGTAEHIDGHMKLPVRDEAMDRLAAQRDKGFHLVSNARCLSEGIDVPVLDAVVFGEPRSSQIDVVQCVGRAIRRNPRTDDPALIILAVRIGSGDDPDEAVAKSDFKKVRQVISALEDHDPRIVQAMKLLVRKPKEVENGNGDSDGSGEKAPDPEPFDDEDAIDDIVETETRVDEEDDDTDDRDTWIVDEDVEVAPPAETGDDTTLDDATPTGDDDGTEEPGTLAWAKQLIALDIPTPLLENGFALRILDTNDRSYEEGLEAVTTYAAEHGHARVPNNYVSPDGHRTGKWVGNRRRDYVAGTLSADRIAELEALPEWSWNPFDEQWATGLAAVTTYAEQNGHARISDSYVSPDGHRTGGWVHKRRGDYAAGKLSADRVAELEALPGWVWSARDEQWATGLAAVTTYAEQNGHARISDGYVSPDSHKTGQWMRVQRRNYAAGTLSADRIAELESLPGWVWNARDEQWAIGVAAVTAYAAENGHARVPADYVSPDGHRTGQWVGVRRGDYAAGKLNPERIAELEAIDGWVWNTIDEKWAAGLSAVRAYAAGNGHANVPQNYVSIDGHRTGGWVSSRREDYVAGRLSADRVAELEALPGWVWNTLDEKWAAGLSAVRAYAAGNGHANVPQNYVSIDGHRTGGWVRSRRRNHAAGKISPDRIAELEALPGWVWIVRDIDNRTYEESLAAVTAYAAKHGHARVPATHVSSDGHRTGGWVSSRRSDYAAGKLSGERIAELEALPGWVWNTIEEKWATGLSAVTAYAAEHGHARVPQSFVSPDGHSTGGWVSKRRNEYAASKLTPDRIAELEALPGWVWKAAAR